MLSPETMPRLLLLLAVLAFAGCDLLESESDPRPTVTGVFVANQGNFSDNNGSLSTYDPETGVASPDALTGLNTLVQSLLVHGDRLYVTANSAGRVDVYDAASLQRVGSIGGLLSPRYLAIADTLAFVTNLYGDPNTFSGGTVSVLGLRSGTKRRDVPVGDNPEGIAVSGTRVYVANSGFGAGSTVSVLDARTGDPVETISVECDGPRSLAVDAEGDVWVFCTGTTTYDTNGNVTGQTNGAVRVLDGATGRILQRLDVDGQIRAAAIGQDVFHSAASAEVFAVLDEARVAVFSTAQNAQTGVITFEAGAAPIGALAYDAEREHLYTGRVTGYTTAGRVTIHRRDGTQTGQFEAGIVPTFIALQETTR